MLAYPDVPNHQSWVPNYAKAKAAWQAFQNKYRTTSGVDIDAELDTLKTTLQGIFDEPAKPVAPPPQASRAGPARPGGATRPSFPTTPEPGAP